MKKDKKWAVSELSTVVPFAIGDDYRCGFKTGIKQAKSIVEQLDEPDKAVVPKFAAEWIEKAKEAEYPLAYAINQTSGELGKWLHTYDQDVDIRKNQELFAKAWVDGYEVEKEKLYQVIIPTKDAVWECYYLDRDGRIYVASNSKYADSHTEEFIRSISDDLWQFAVEVAE